MLIPDVSESESDHESPPSSSHNLTNAGPPLRDRFSTLTLQTLVNEDEDDPASLKPFKTEKANQDHRPSALSATGIGIDGRHPSPIRHPDFWFRDGSIILQVQSKLFRVHQTILANHSEVFAGLFDVPQPVSVPLSDEDEEGGSRDGMLEGCHIVVLSDSEKDFEDLLKAVYNPSYFEENLSPTADVDTVLDFISGILRLSTKYLIRGFRQRCITILSSKFPTTLEEYNLKSVYSSTPTPVASSSHRHRHRHSSNHHSPGHHPHHHPSSSSSTSPAPPLKERYKSDSLMRAALLAHETNVPLVLPYLYYCIGRSSLRRLTKHKDGDISWYEKTLCLAGRERLRYAEMSLSYAFLAVWQRAPGCRGLGGGGSTSNSLGNVGGLGSVGGFGGTASLLSSLGSGSLNLACSLTRGPEHEWRLIQVSKAPNPLRQYSRWDKLGVCGECVEWSRELHERGRRDVWERLPGFFGLGTWDELRGVQNA